MSAVNRRTISTVDYRLGDASEYTQIVRWSKESLVKPLPGRVGVSRAVAVNLLTVANLVLTEQISVPSDVIECLKTLLYGGDVLTTDFYITLDGENITYTGDFILEDGGTPSSIFC